MRGCTVSAVGAPRFDAAVAEWMRREFPKLVDAGSISAGSSLLARVAQGKSKTRGEGLVRVQISPRALGLRIEEERR